MARYLVTFRDNHMEEFDVNGFKIMSEKELSRFEELANSITWEFAYYANNEALVYSNGEDFLSRIDYKEITKDDYDVIDKVFGEEYGTFINEDYLQTVIDGEDKYEGGDEYDDELDFGNDDQDF